MKTLIEIEAKELKDKDLCIYNAKTKMFEPIQYKILNNENVSRFNELEQELKELKELVNKNSQNITTIAKIIKGE